MNTQVEEEIKYDLPPDSEAIRVKGAFRLNIVEPDGKIVGVAIGADTFMISVAESIGVGEMVFSIANPQVYSAFVYCNPSSTVILDSQPSPAALMVANPTPNQEVEIG